MAADRSEGPMMREPRDKIFITCAVTGNLTTPEQTPHLPITPEQIADACLGAAEAGAPHLPIYLRATGIGQPPLELVPFPARVARIPAPTTPLTPHITPPAGP